MPFNGKGHSYVVVAGIFIQRFRGIHIQGHSFVVMAGMWGWERLHAYSTFVAVLCLNMTCLKLVKCVFHMQCSQTVCYFPHLYQHAFNHTLLYLNQCIEFTIQCQYRRSVINLHHPICVVNILNVCVFIDTSASIYGRSMQVQLSFHVI